MSKAGIKMQKFINFLEKIKNRFSLKNNRRQDILIRAIKLLLQEQNFGSCGIRPSHKGASLS